MKNRLAKSLEVLRDNVNAAAPHRNRQSDGWIGDVRHSKTKSDHNPNQHGVVLALDITHDPKHGVDCTVLAQALIEDPRCKYVIWNQQIFNPAIRKEWRDYKGKNPHDRHLHISVKPDHKIYDSNKPWDIKLQGGLQAPHEKPDHPILKFGDQSDDVLELQEKLGVDVDGDFGPKTENAVKALQRKHGLVPDGIVGPYTWLALDKGQ